MDLPQTENVHNTALGAHWARVTPSNLILTSSNRRHACATLTVARPWAHGPVLRAAASWVPRKPPPTTVTLSISPLPPLLQMESSLTKSDSVNAELIGD